MGALFQAGRGTADVTIHRVGPMLCCVDRESQRVDFARVLETVAGFFERTGFRYAVIGAFGLHAYGLSRGTFDLDFVSEAGAQPQLVGFFESLGYETLHVSAGYSNHLHAT